MEDKDEKQLEEERERSRQRLAVEEDEEKRQTYKIGYALAGLVFIGLSVPFFMLGGDSIALGIFCLLISIPWLYGSFRRTRVYEKFKLETKEKISTALLVVFLLVVLFIGLIVVDACVNHKSRSSYEPTVSDVWKWFDEKDKDGNYVNRGEYNKQRSY